MDPSFQPPIKTGFFFHNHDWNADDLWGFLSACLGHRNPDRHERKARKNQHLADLVDTVIGINQQTKRILQTDYFVRERKFEHLMAHTNEMIAISNAPPYSKNIVTDEDRENDDRLYQELRHHGEMMLKYISTEMSPDSQKEHVDNKLIKDLYDMAHLQRHHRRSVPLVHPRHHQEGPNHHLVELLEKVKGINKEFNKIALARYNSSNDQYKDLLECTNRMIEIIDSCPDNIHIVTDADKSIYDQLLQQIRLHGKTFLNYISSPMVPLGTKQLVNAKLIHALNLVANFRQ